MKIAIASTGNSLSSPIDNRFGRCSYFVIFDTETESAEFIPNPNKEAESESGAESVNLIAKHNVSKIISGDFGMSIKPQLDSLKIQMIIVKKPMTKIKDIINLIIS